MSSEIKKDKTVIVVGAGASHEFGLPVGSMLQDDIAEVARYDFQGGGSRTINSGQRLLVSAAGLNGYSYKDERRLKSKANRIALGVQNAASIDNFLHANQADSELIGIGKLAIAGCILAAEKRSSLGCVDAARDFRGARKGQDIPQPHNSWIGILVKTLTSGRDFQQFCAAISTVTFVCFNYDRCVERYVFVSASRIYPEDEFEIETLNSALHIIHPYGSLGDLLAGSGQATFGEVANSNFLLSAARSIRTFTEGMKSEVRAKIEASFAGASRAIFLGYGFISVNDEFLFGGSPFQMASVLGTTYGISSERTEAISKKLRNALLMKKTPFDGWQPLSEKPQLRAESCSALLHRFSHVLEEIGK